MSRPKDVLLPVDLTPYTLRELADRAEEFGGEAIREELLRRKRAGIPLDADVRGDGSRSDA